MNVHVENLASPKNANEILREILERKTKFTCDEHDGSKLDKARTSVRNGLVLIKM